MALTVVVLSVMVAAALWSVVTLTMLRAAIGLALVSVLLAVVLFTMGATLAAVFELSIGAGLIPVLFVSVVSLTRRQQQEERPMVRRIYFRRFWPLPLVLLAAGIALTFVHLPIAVAPPVQEGGPRAIFWVSRRLDLFGQVLIVVAGALGIVVLFKEGPK